MILLTEEEINALEEDCVDCGGHDELEVAKAQLKKVVEWGSDCCEHLSPAGAQPRFKCSLCRQVLLKEIE